MSRAGAHDWRPDASLDTLAARAKLLADIRAFFAARDVLEVDTPAASRAAACDPNLQSLMVSPAAADAPRYLFTSPEFPMKRLLAAGSGPIYQLGHVFRAAEAGAWHNPEFCMLEWYRPGWDYRRLMREVRDLLQCLAPAAAMPVTLTLQQWFMGELDLDPHTATAANLRTAAQARGWAPAQHPPDTVPTARAFWLDAIVGLGLVRELQEDAPCFVLDYPACQASLTRLSNDDPPVAQRFELYWRGVELANGGNELTDARELAVRFHAENAARIAAGLQEMPIDWRLLAALENGLPDCAGVALGVDRLLALMLGRDGITSSMPFGWARA